MDGEYINTGSYMPASAMLTVLQDGKTPLTFKVTQNTAIKVNVHAAGIDVLAGRFKVATKVPGQGNTLNSIDLVDVPRQLNMQDTRSFLLGAVIVEFAVILLIVTNAAASTVTREKEDGSLDLLLTTPITSRYYVWGKLRGLVSFVIPLIAVPVLSVLMFVTYIPALSTALPKALGF
jgi:ABC-type Na+ efflux pump permease subunit